MNIHPDPFENLTRLMAIKKHEAPPPGYFAHFSDRVVARIEAEEEARATSWWRRLGLNFEFSPTLLCATGVFLSTALLAGMVLAIDPAPSMVAVNHSAPGGDAFEMTSGGFAGSAAGLTTIQRPEEIHASTEPVGAYPCASPFSHFEHSAQLASWAMR